MRVDAADTCDLADPPLNLDVGALPYRRGMRRGYVEAHLPLKDSFRAAVEWLEGKPTLIAPSTGVIETAGWLESAGIPLGTTSNRHSRFGARPRGAIMAWCLHLDEILDLESHDEVDSIVVVRAHATHAPWVTAHAVDHVAGETIERVSEASPAIKAMVEGLSLLPVLNQGLTDSRERAMVVQALTFMHARGHKLVPEQLVVEAIRNDWPRQSPLQLADLARSISQGRRLRFQTRLRTELLEEWASL